MVSRISPIDPSQAERPVRDLLGRMKTKIGMVPNALRTMARSPALLEGYLSLRGALSKDRRINKCRNLTRRSNTSCRATALRLYSVDKQCNRSPPRTAYPLSTA
jgi:hypothetical protein